MVEKEVILSPEGLRKLEQELEHLRTVKRREVAERIKQSRQFGEVGENSEYEEAKNEQAFIEGRIMTLESILRTARVVDRGDFDPEVVGIGSAVRLKDLDSEEIVEYIIVGSTEADPAASRISHESPVGRAVFGQKAGASVVVHAPAGTLRYEILEVRPPSQEAQASDA